MANPATLARLKFLNDSAHLLVINAPATSAYLMSQCNDLMFENELDQSDAHRRHVCGACGNIMILGWTGTRQLESARAPKGKHTTESWKQQSSNARVKTMVYTCGRCRRRTRLTLNTTIPRSSKTSNTVSKPKALQAATIPESHPSETDLAIKTPSSGSANARSRKRAKIRKQGGLQALLAKSKEKHYRESSGTFGLDLLDLMKKA